jgi:hypothetical protein
MRQQRSISVNSRPVKNVQRTNPWSSYSNSNPLKDANKKPWSNPPPLVKQDCIVFEDSHPFAPQNRLRIIFSKKLIYTPKPKENGFKTCGNVQQLFVTLCLSSIKNNLQSKPHVLMSAKKFENHEENTQNYNSPKRYSCKAFFLDLDGIDAQEIVKTYKIEGELRTQMTKLKQVKQILKKSTDPSMIVGFISANAESMEYNGLRPEYIGSRGAIENMMVTSVGLELEGHEKYVDRGWFKQNKQDIFNLMKGKMYLDVSKEFFDDTQRKDVLVGVYIRKQTESKHTSRSTGMELEQICQPIQTSDEAFSAFANGMRITRVKWHRTRKAGGPELVRLDAHSFDWDYLEELKNDVEFKAAVEKIYGMVEN